jgi:indolepyruvate ferredoxin oxidoreductase
VDTRSAPSAEASRLIESTGATGELRRLLDIRVPELIDYQDAAYARAYVEFVRRVAEAERAAVPGETRLAEMVARYLFKLMAYKDEYEVARLHLRTALGRTLAAELPGPVRVRYHLHPPLLRALGIQRKLVLGRWVEGVFRLLVALRRLRGTPFDPFGAMAVRRVERALIGEYRAMVEATLGDLSPESHARAVRIARLPDLVRGYESIKLAGVARFRAEARAMRGQA